MPVSGGEPKRLTMIIAVAGAWPGAQTVSGSYSRRGFMVDWSCSRLKLRRNSTTVGCRHRVRFDSSHFEERRSTRLLPGAPRYKYLANRSYRVNSSQVAHKTYFVYATWTTVHSTLPTTRKSHSLRVAPAATKSGFATPMVRTPYPSPLLVVQTLALHGGHLTGNRLLWFFGSGTSRRFHYRFAGWQGTSSYGPRLRQRSTELVTRWAMDLLRIESQWRLATLEGACSGRSACSAYTQRRSRGFRISRWKVCVLRQGLWRCRTLESTHWGWRWNVGTRRSLPGPLGFVGQRCLFHQSWHRSSRRDWVLQFCYGTHDESVGSWEGAAAGLPESGGFPWW
jgi:Coenzyme F420-dependent N5,N10-methylene tetrahydromethanopterin reductase and related flavin-dependent oxidoreductases